MTGTNDDPGLVLAPKAPPTLSSRRTVVAAAVVTIVSAAVVRFGDDRMAPGRDEVSADEIARRAAIASTMAPLKLKAVAPAERQAAIAAMALPPADQAVLTADLANNRVRLAWMSFYDSDVEDGDVITISSGGFSQVLRLTKQPVAIALPAPADGFVRVIGSVDGGGGGVTVGIVTPAGPTPLAVLSVGQVISVPVVAE